MPEKENNDTGADERFMRLALHEARGAAALGEVPIGAVVVCDGQVVARGANRREIDADPTAHAELIAVREAASALGRWRLEGCTVYVTLEPCPMCAGALHAARVDRCVYGAVDPKAGALGTLYDIASDERLNHRYEVTAGVLADDSALLLKRFFEGLRARGRAPEPLEG
jgi:tRNA(adenine34) deaminase